MPLLVQAIGPYTFDSLRGEFQYMRERLEIIERPAVDGSGIRRQGLAGRPFTIETWRYESTRNTAEAVFRSYKLLEQDNPVLVVHNSIVQRDVFQVLLVEKAAIPPAGVTVGSIVPNPSCLLVATWTLLPMPSANFVRQA